MFYTHRLTHGHACNAFTISYKKLTNKTDVKFTKTDKQIIKIWTFYKTAHLAVSHKGQNYYFWVCRTLFSHSACTSTVLDHHTQCAVSAAACSDSATQDE
jgi:hypothetical protein